MYKSIIILLAWSIGISAYASQIGNWPMKLKDVLNKNCIVIQGEVVSIKIEKKELKDKAGEWEGREYKAKFQFKPSKTLMGNDIKNEKIGVIYKEDIWKGEIGLIPGSCKELTLKQGDKVIFILTKGKKDPYFLIRSEAVENREEVDKLIEAIKKDK
jgi:hypothetical protein